MQMTFVGQQPHDREVYHQTPDSNKSKECELQQAVPARTSEHGGGDTEKIVCGTAAKA